ncbi:MAG: DUF4382 domain-containing protein [archaeon]|nr:MAG: DUF4382 domain-containing protein [archaeon]
MKMKNTLVLGITFLLVLAGTVQAQQQQSQAMGIPPDSPFYFFQGWSEGFHGMFRGGDPEFHEELAMRRQAEIWYLEEKGEEGLIERLRLRERAQEHFEEAQRMRQMAQQRASEQANVPEQESPPGPGGAGTQGTGGQGTGSQEGTQGTGGQTGSFVLMVSDTPADIADFESLVVSFSKARIFSVENNSEGFEEYQLNGTSVDLTQVVGEKAISVLNVELAEGTYNKVEMHVSEVNGTVNGTQVDVEVPSNKLQIVRSFQIKAGETTKFVFDINVVKKGHSDEYNLLPVIGKSGIVGQDLQEEEVEETECTVDEDCQENEICVEGECQGAEEPECTEDSDCGENQTCVENVCMEMEQVECTEDEDCGENETCVEGECEPFE